MKYFFLLGLFVSSHGWSQIRHQAKVSKDIPGKTSLEIKEMVLFNGASDAIKKYAEINGKDYASFSKNLNEKFEAFFKLHKEHEFTQSFGKNNENVLPQDKESFLISIEKMREPLFRKFTTFIDTIESYAVKDGIVEILLNQEKVERLLKKHLNNVPKQYANLWLSSEVNLQGLTWDQFDLSSAESFKMPIEKSWHRWIEDHLPENVEGVSICNGSCQQVFNSWTQRSQDEILGFAGPEYLNGVWANLTINLRASNDPMYSKGKVFEWDGRIVFLDVNTKRLLASIELPSEKISLSDSDQKKMNSDLASLLYRTGASGLTGIFAQIKELRNLNRVSRLGIQGHKHILDVYNLIKELKSKGDPLGLDAQLDFFKVNEAQILCFYQGEEKSFSDLLSRLKELKLSQSYKLVNEHNGVHYVLKLMND